MSPDKYETAQGLEEQAYGIKEELIKRQTIDDEAARVLDQEYFEEQREKGIIDRNPADISDLKDQRIASMTPGFSPQKLEERLPVSQKSAETTRKGRKNVESILTGEDDRLVVYMGACSVHDVEATLEYNEQFSALREKHESDLVLVQRVYLEKPRTVAGWKGLIYDPYLTEFFNPDKPEYDYSYGLTLGRMLLIAVTHSGNPAVLERLNPQIPQYTDALSTVDVLGARNSYDQNGRALLSQTSAIAAAKHGLDGSLEQGVDTVESIYMPHSSIGNHMSAPYAQIQSKGNHTAHMMLRGGKVGNRHIRNYTSEYVEEALRLIAERNSNKKGLDLLHAIGIDASHGNSLKDFTKQQEVVDDVAKQITDGHYGIKEIAIESNLVGGAQKAPKSGKKSDLEYGQSITDGCVSMTESRIMLDQLACAVRSRRKKLGRD